MPSQTIRGLMVEGSTSQQECMEAYDRLLAREVLKKGIIKL